MELRNRQTFEFSLQLYTACIILLFLLIGSCASDEVRKAPVDPEVALREADEMIEKDDYDEARQLLQEVKGADTAQKYAPIAQLKIAESYAKEGNIDLAVAEYKRSIEQYPDSQYAPYAQYQIAMLYFSQIKGPERGAGEAKRALAEFRTLKTAYPRNPYKDIIEINMRKCLNTIADYEFIVGKFYFKKNSYKAALGRFIGILKEYPDYKSTDEVLLYTARSYKRSGDRENALKYFGTLRQRFPESSLIGKFSKELSDGD